MTLSARPYMPASGMTDAQKAEYLQHLAMLSGLVTSITWNFDGDTLTELIAIQTKEEHAADHIHPTTDRLRAQLAEARDLLAAERGYFSALAGLASECIELANLGYEDYIVQYPDAQHCDPNDIYQSMRNLLDEYSKTVRPYK